MVTHPSTNLVLRCLTSVSNWCFPKDVVHQLTGRVCVRLAPQSEYGVCRLLTDNWHVYEFENAIAIFVSYCIISTYETIYDLRGEKVRRIKMYNTPM